MAVKLASKNQCTACLACLDSCKHNAIKDYIAKDGHLYVKINTDLCVECGKCLQACSVISKYNYEASDRKSQPYASWANDMELRLKSASGGLFGAMASYILSKGGVVAGAVMDGIEVKHILIDTVRDLSKIQNSKYQQVNSKGIYKSVKEKLKDGKTVLFGGTPCQIAGLYCYLGTEKFADNLYTADMICSGFPSGLALDAFLKHKKEPVETLIYRDKNNGCIDGQRLTVVIANTGEKASRVETHDKSLVYSAFGTHYTLRNSCLNCRYAYAKRKADITMADFWGDNDFPEEHYNGISLAVVHTPMGLKLMESSDLTTHISSWEKVLKVNFRMVYGTWSILKYHPAKIFSSWIFSRFSYSALLRIYRGNDAYGLFWYAYLLFCKSIGFLEKQKRNFVIKKETDKLR